MCRDGVAVSWRGSLTVGSDDRRDRAIESFSHPIPDDPLTMVRVLLERSAPFEAVFRTEDAPHPEPVIFDSAARVAGDDDVIARLERVVVDAVQLTRGGPFNGPALGLPLIVRGLDVHEGMRIPEHER